LAPITHYQKQIILKIISEGHQLTLSPSFPSCPASPGEPMKPLKQENNLWIISFEFSPVQIILSGST
jgi:hypothetical protein